MNFMYLWGLSIGVLILFILCMALYVCIGVLIAKGVNKLLKYSLANPKRERVNTVVGVTFIFLLVSLGMAVTSYYGW